MSGRDVGSIRSRRRRSRSREKDQSRRARLEKGGPRSRSCSSSSQRCRSPPRRSSRGGFDQRTLMPEDFVVQQTLARMATASPDVAYPKVNPEVEAFLVQNAVEPHAASQLRCLPPEQQQLVIQRSLLGARDPTAVIIGRIRNVARGGSAQLTGMKGHFQRPAVPQNTAMSLATIQQPVATSQAAHIQQVSSDDHQSTHRFPDEINGCSSDGGMMARNPDNMTPTDMEIAGTDAHGIGSAVGQVSVPNTGSVWPKDLKSLLRSGDFMTRGHTDTGASTVTQLSSTWAPSLSTGSWDADELFHAKRNVPGGTSQKMHASLVELREWLSGKEVPCPPMTSPVNAADNADAKEGELVGTVNSNVSQAATASSILGRSNNFHCSRPFSSRPFTTAVVASDPDPYPLPLLQSSPQSPIRSENQNVSIQNVTTWTVPSVGVQPDFVEDQSHMQVSPIDPSTAFASPLGFCPTAATGTCNTSGSNSGDLGEVMHVNEIAQQTDVAHAMLGMVSGPILASEMVPNGSHDIPRHLALAQQIEMQQQVDLQMQYHKFWVQQQMAAQMSLFETQRAFGTGGLSSVAGDGTRKRDPTSKTNTQPMLPGDWNCPDCGDHQFARNRACRACGAMRPPGAY